LGALRLGVFGGTFNPIHRGHLHIALRTLQLFELTQVHFVVATVPPHKPHDEVIPFIHRYAMVCLAISAISSFVPSLAELDAPWSPFSIRTMEKFARKEAGAEAGLYFIAGGDSLLDLPSWRESTHLLTSYNFIFVARPGVAGADAGAVFGPQIASRLRDWRRLAAAELKDRIRAEVSCGEKRIFVIDAGAPDISASQIRRLAAAGRSIRHLVPGAVHQYIHKLHLYGER
jgi:nicotinate-nucleotide adenylyltransferase